MKRFEIYWDIYTDMRGVSRQIPVLVVSNDTTNNDPNSLCVQTLRLTREERWPSPVHLFIPKEAWAPNSQLTDCVALCDTVSSTKKTDLYGAIGYLKDETYQRKIEHMIEAHLGIVPLPEMPQVSTPIQPRGIYSGAYGTQTRRTVYQEPRTPAQGSFQWFGRIDNNDSIAKTIHANDVPNTTGPHGGNE